ncbi:MAG TPA: hypothetical protein VIV40_26860 [Kofleriaceae bacterium]
MLLDLGGLSGPRRFEECEPGITRMPGICQRFCPRDQECASVLAIECTEPQRHREPLSGFVECESSYRSFGSVLGAERCLLRLASLCPVVSEPLGWRISILQRAGESRVCIAKLRRRKARGHDFTHAIVERFDGNGLSGGHLEQMGARQRSRVRDQLFRIGFGRSLERCRCDGAFRQAHQP